MASLLREIGGIRRVGKKGSKRSPQSWRRLVHPAGLAIGGTKPFARPHPVGHPAAKGHATKHRVGIIASPFGGGRGRGLPGQARPVKGGSGAVAPGVSKVPRTATLPGAVTKPAVIGRGEDRRREPVTNPPPEAEPGETSTGGSGSAGGSWGGSPTGGGGSTGGGGPSGGAGEQSGGGAEDQANDGAIAPADNPPEHPAAAPEGQDEQASSTQDETPWWKRKKTMVPAAVGVLLLIGAGYWFYSKSKKTKEGE